MFAAPRGVPIVPRQLPRPPKSFVNRTSSLELLDLMAADAGSADLSTIAGAPGVGKTALALHWAHRVVERFPDGALYANLRGFDPVNPRADPGEVLDAFLHALGLPTDSRTRDSVEARAAEFRSAVHGRRMLIVLDDAENAEQVRPLLPGSASVVVVVTSRNALSGLKARDGASSMSLDPLPTDEAVTLLARIVDDGRIAADRPAAARLAALCANLPLALCVAAELLVSRSHHSVADLIADLDDERDRLDLLQTDEPASTVRAVFSASYRALDPGSARVFRLLGLHRGAEISFQTAAALTGSRPAALRPALQALTTANLITAIGPDRYRLHDLVRIFAAECAAADESEAGQADAARRMLGFYLGSAQATGRRLAPQRRMPGAPAGQGAEFDDRNTALAWCELEQANLVSATRHAAALGEHLVAWQLPAALWAYFHQRKPWAAWIETHEIGLHSARILGDATGVAMLLGSLAVAHREQRRPQKAEACFGEALSVSAQAGDLYGQAMACNGYGNACREWGRLDEALVYSQRALAAWHELADLHGEAITHNSLSGVHRDRGDLVTALQHSEHAISMFHELGDRHAEVWALNNAANVHRDLGNLEQAVQAYRTVLRTREELGDRYGVAFTLQAVAEAYRRLGNLEDFRVALEQALPIFDELGDPKAEEVRSSLAESRGQSRPG